MKKKSMSLAGGSRLPVGGLTAAKAGAGSTPVSSGAMLATPIGGQPSLIGNRIHLIR